MMPPVLKKLLLLLLTLAVSVAQLSGLKRGYICELSGAFTVATLHDCSSHSDEEGAHFHQHHDAPTEEHEHHPEHTELIGLNSIASVAFPLPALVEPCAIHLWFDNQKELMAAAELMPPISVIGKDTIPCGSPPFVVRAVVRLV